MTSNGATEASDSQSFEAKLWQACEAQRGTVHPSHYKYPVLGLVFLKYVNDTFDACRGALETRPATPDGNCHLNNPTGRPAPLPGRDECLSRNVFWIPPDARWNAVRANASHPDIAARLDAAMGAIEAENPALKGALPKSFTASAVPPQSLTSLIGIVDSINFGDGPAGRDKLGQVYEYFLGKFSSVEGRSGEDYTPRSVVELLVEMLEPYSGRIYDPCCGTGGMFVQSRRFLDAHGRAGSDVSVYGQESNAETWRLAKMNLALHGIDGDLGGREASAFTADLHPDLRADFIITNPPFNLGEKNKAGWGRDRLLEDARWQVGGVTLLPPPSNANYAWILHFLHHLSPDGVAGFVLANGALSNVNRSEEVAIREALVEAGVVDCIVSLPAKLFANTQIPVSLWFVAKNRGQVGRFRERWDETLFIDARRLGRLVSRRQREMTAADISRIAAAYHSYRDAQPAAPYTDVAGFCKKATREDIANQGFVLSPGRYVDIDCGDDEVDAAARLDELRTQLFHQLDLAHASEERLRELLTNVTAAADG